MSFCYPRMKTLIGPRGFAYALRSATGAPSMSKPQIFSQHALRSFASSTGETTDNHPADGQYDYSYVAEDERFENQKPTLRYAKGMPRDFSEMRHEQILQLSVEGSYGARREALTRNVMSVDSIEYDEALVVVEEIAKVNRQHIKIESFPYQAGITTALAGGFLSFPLVFHQDTAMWFNENFVTTDVPEMKDLETFCEVGSWSWGWMEPLIGQASFFLLVLQFARSQALKLGIKPYGDAMLSMRSQRLKKMFPQYNALFLEWYADSEAMYGKISPQKD